MNRFGSPIPGAGPAARGIIPRWLACLVTTAVALGLWSTAHGSTEFASTKPTARIDYWQQRQLEITTYLKESKNLSTTRLLFLGDSITDFWHLGDNPWFPGQKCGRCQRLALTACRMTGQ